MSVRIVRFLQRWVVITVGILIAAHLVPGISYGSPVALGVAALLLGFLNAFVRPILVILTLPILLITFGIFYFVINAGLLWVVGSVVQGFKVAGFWPAFWGGLVISVVSFTANRLLGTPEADEFRSRSKASKDRNESGPVIDV